MGQEIREVGKKTLCISKMSFSGEIWSSGPSGKINFYNLLRQSNRIFTRVSLALEILLSLLHPNTLASIGMDSFIMN